MLKRVRVVKRSDTRRGRSKAAIKGQCRITRVISSQFHTVHWTVRTQVSMVFPGLFKSQLLAGISVLLNQFSFMRGMNVLVM